MNHNVSNNNCKLNWMRKSFPLILISTWYYNESYVNKSYCQGNFLLRFRGFFVARLRTSSELYLFDKGNIITNSFKSHGLLNVNTSLFSSKLWSSRPWGYKKRLKTNLMKKMLNICGRDIYIYRREQSEPSHLLFTFKAWQ